eukprot:s1424_g18.t1
MYSVVEKCSSFRSVGTSWHFSTAFQALPLQGWSVLQSATTLARRMVHGERDHKAEGFPRQPKRGLTFEIHMYNDSDDLDDRFF